MSDETLKPCPFCKSEAVLDKVDEGADYRPWFWYTVHCSNRDCVCADLCHEYETEAEAIAAWNTRAAKICYATDYTHEHCKYSVNRGWTEDTRFYISTPAKQKSGTLTAEQVRDAIERHITFYEGGDYDEKAIADELNAALGGGECEMKPIPFMGWQCSKCGRVSMVFGSGDKDREMPRFCPSCGKAVKR